MNAVQTETTLRNYGWGLIANSDSVCSEGKRKTNLKSFWGDFLCTERTEGVVDDVCAVAINHLCCPRGHHPRLKEIRFQN